MTKDEAIEKAKKLLRLAQSDNVHEAALAMQRAQEILERYELTSSVLDEQGQDEEIEDFSTKGAPLDQCHGKQLATWKNYLSAVIAKANGCKTFIRWEWSTDKQKDLATLHIVGRPSDAEVVRYLYLYIAREVERLCLRDGKGCGKTWRNQFRLGVVDTVRDKLKEARQATATSMRAEYQNNPMALVKIDQALVKMETKTASVEVWMKSHMKLRQPSGHRVNSDPTARNAGRRAGKEIQIHSAKKGALGAGKKMIGV
jgi:hypothetical protein